MIRKIILLLNILFFSIQASYAQINHEENYTLPLTEWFEPGGLECFRQAYPELLFVSSYDQEEMDWIITIYAPDSNNGMKRKCELYWCESKLLPKQELQNKDKYQRMLYKIDLRTPNPEEFTNEHIEYIKKITSKEGRLNSLIEPPFFYNYVFDCSTETDVSKHIGKVQFLGKTVSVHEKIQPVLKRVEKKLKEQPKTNEMKIFISDLYRVDGYNWRTVRDNMNRSFHSYGFAVDILPKGYYHKNIYWGWQKQWNPERWWATPISERWMPPRDLIHIFESEGFVWGGNWIVWDNMHFEYHPELYFFTKRINDEKIMHD